MDEVLALLGQITDEYDRLLGSLQERTQDVAPAVERLGTALSGLRVTSNEFNADSLKQLQASFRELSRGATAGRINELAKSLELAAINATPLPTIFGTLSNYLGAVSKNIASILANPLSGLARGFTAAAAPTAAAAGGMSGALGAITGAVMGPLGQLAGAVGPFVAALNPSLMRLFNQALRDLMATFGVALTPAIQHISALFNELSATIAPAMRALAPIIDNLMSILEGTLVPVIGIIADAFVALSPVIELVTSIMASIAEAMRVFYTVLRSALQVIWEVVKNLFGGVDLKGAAEGIRDVIHQLTKYFVQFAAYVAKALGYLDPFAKALEKNLKDLEGQRPGQKAAPENVRVTGLEQISKDLAVAAFAAQGAGGQRKKSEAEFLEELIKEVREVQKNGQTLSQFLDTMGDKIIKQLIDGFEGDLGKLWQWFLEWWRGRPDFKDRKPDREGVDPAHLQPRNLGLV